MILVVDAIGSRAEVFSPASTSPLLISVSAHARAATSGASCAWATSVPHTRKRASAMTNFAMFEVSITGA
jgi:hypothetical protein